MGFGYPQQQKSISNINVSWTPQWLDLLLSVSINYDYLNDDGDIIFSTIFFCDIFCGFFSFLFFRLLLTYSYSLWLLLVFCSLFLHYLVIQLNRAKEMNEYCVIFSICFYCFFASFHSCLLFFFFLLLLWWYCFPSSFRWCFSWSYFCCCLFFWPFILFGIDSLFLFTLTALYYLVKPPLSFSLSGLFFFVIIFPFSRFLFFFLKHYLLFFFLRLNLLQRIFFFFALVFFRYHEAFFVVVVVIVRLLLFICC